MALVPIPPSAPFIPRTYSKAYWLDPVNGNDNNTGTSIEKPWKTLNKVFATPETDASTINLAPGTYTGAAITTGDLDLNIVGIAAPNSNQVSIQNVITATNSTKALHFANLTLDANFISSGSGVVYMSGVANSPARTFTKSGTGTTTLSNCDFFYSSVTASAGVFNAFVTPLLNLSLTGATGNLYECPYVGGGGGGTSITSSTLNAFRTTFVSTTPAGRALTSVGVNTVRLRNTTCLDSNGALTSIVISSSTGYLFDDASFDKAGSSILGTPVTNYQTYFSNLGIFTLTQPDNNVNPILYYDGTKLTVNSAPSKLGYDATNDVVYTSNLFVSSATGNTAVIRNTSANSNAGGAVIQGLQFSSSVVSINTRLGFFSLGGRTTAGGATNNSSGIEAFATENWTSTAAGSNLSFSTTGNGSTVRGLALRLNEDKSSNFFGSITTSSYVEADYYGQAPQTLSNYPTGGSLGGAAATVDIASVFNIPQTTAGQNITLPTPTVSLTRNITINNTGTASFTVNSGLTVYPSTSATFNWNLSNWLPGTAIWNGGNVTNPVSVTFTGVGTNTLALITATGSNTQGGSTYVDFLKASNTAVGATNAHKYFRISNTGTLEIVNSAYTATILALSDTGAMSTSQYQVNGKQAVNGPAFAAYANSTTQTIPSGTQTKVLFQTEEYDTNNNFASSRFTPTIEGYYQLNAAVRIEGPSSTGENMLVLYKNGSEYKRGNNGSGTEIGASFYSMQVSSLAYANGTGDYFEIYIQQGSGSNKNLTAVNAQNITWFNGCMVRGG